MSRSALVRSGPSSVSMRRSLISTGTLDPSARRPSASTLIVTGGPSGSRGRSRSSVGTSDPSGWPSSRSRGMPKRRSVCEFAKTMVPERSLTTIASGADSSRVANSCADLARCIASAARLRSVTSIPMPRTQGRPSTITRCPVKKYGARLPSLETKSASAVAWPVSEHLADALADVLAAHPLEELRRVHASDLLAAVLADRGEGFVPAQELALVVEHVEDAGQRSDDVVRELLLAFGALLRGAPLTDVDAHADQRGAIAEHDALAGEPTRVARAVPGDQLGLGVGGAGDERFAHLVGEVGAHLGGEELERMPGRDLGGGAAGDALELLVPAQDPLVVIDEEEEPGQGLDDRVGQRLLAGERGGAFGDHVLQLVAGGFQRFLARVAVRQSDEHRQARGELAEDGRRRDARLERRRREARRFVEVGEVDAAAERALALDVDEPPVELVVRRAQRHQIALAHRREHGGEEGLVDEAQDVGRQRAARLEILGTHRGDLFRPFGGDRGAFVPELLGERGERRAFGRVEVLGE